jgi:hypothetical protein
MMVAGLGKAKDPVNGYKNWIKMYDKSKVVLRIETVINDSRKFKVRRKGRQKGREVMGYFPRNKRVSHLPHYLRHAQRMNYRYLDALTGIQDPGPSFKGLEKWFIRFERTLFL